MESGTWRRCQSTADADWRGKMAVGFLFAAFISLQVKSASAESLSAPAAFDSRFAAVEIADQKKQVVTTTTSQAKESGDRTAKTEPPPPRPLDRYAIYRALIEPEAARAGLSPEIAEAVMAVESGYHPAAIGGVGEIGLMQILPST